MRTRSVTWVLNNKTRWTFAQHLNRLSKLLIRNCPDEYVIQNIVMARKNESMESLDVNRRLNHECRREILQFLMQRQDQIVFFKIRFVSYANRFNGVLSLSGSAPFDRVILSGEYTPNWLHELVNRKFQKELPWQQKLWSYFYNRRIFPHSLSR